MFLGKNPLSSTVEQWGEEFRAGIPFYLDPIETPFTNDIIIAKLPKYPVSWFLYL